MMIGGQRTKVLRAHTAGADVGEGTVDDHAVLGTAHGALALDEVQPAGKRPMPAEAWRRGLHGAVRVDDA